MNDASPRVHGGFKSLNPHPSEDKLVNGPVFYKFGAPFKWALAEAEKAKDQDHMSI